MATQQPRRRLPVKVVLATKDDYPSREKSGGGWEPFRRVTRAFRSDLLGNIQDVSNYFAPAFRRWPEVPGIAKVQLRNDALAKTYRPTSIFDESTCPIVGGSRFGELYVSVTPARLQALGRRIGTDSTDAIKRQLSVLSTIAPFTTDDALFGSSVKKGEPLRLRLFQHHALATDDRIHTIAKELCTRGKIEAIDAPYGQSMRVLRLDGVKKRTAEDLAAFPGTQSLSVFPKYRAARTTSIKLKVLPNDAIAAPDPNREYPVVLLVDSGTDPRNQQLQKWVVGRWDAVKRPKQDNDHGSFVAGLLCQSRRLNDDEPAFPSCGAKIIDVVAIDETEVISEIELVTILYAALKKYPQARIVNLSLSIDGGVCEDDEFSSLAVALDGFSRQFGVRFAVPTGNYEQISCTWPRQREIGSDDRVLSPADHILGIPSGSIAHRDSHKTTVRAGDPSPFTRGGPGPAYVPAPLLVHNGGNMDENGDYFRTGIISVDGSGNLAEDAGVSFSNPLIASLYANVEHQLSDDSSDAFCLAKCFLIHSAILEQLPVDERFNYCGFGRPPDFEKIVSCEQSAVTVVFQAKLEDGKRRFSKHNFPMPSCLIVDGKLDCEILMTTVYEPPLDASFGGEYCRVNVDAALGTIRKGDFQTEVEPVPRRRTEGYESQLIKEGFKWSPVKAYYRRLTRMEAGLPWELRVDVKKRANHTIPISQDVCVLLTIRDPAGKANVYDEMVRSMNRLAWSPQDLRVRSRQRGRAH